MRRLYHALLAFRNGDEVSAILPWLPYIPILQLRYKLVHLWSSATAAKVNIWQFFAWNCVDAAVHVAETPIQGQLLENNGGERKNERKFVARIIKGIDAWNRNRGCRFHVNNHVWNGYRTLLLCKMTCTYRVIQFGRGKWFHGRKKVTYKTRHSFLPILVSELIKMEIWYQCIR